MLRRPVEAAQYLSFRYTSQLAEAGTAPSVGSRGDSYDNAFAESIVGLHNTALVRHEGPWKGMEDRGPATLNWVWWFNNKRLFGPIGHAPPVEYEEAFSRLIHDARPPSGKVSLEGDMRFVEGREVVGGYRPPYPRRG